MPFDMCGPACCFLLKCLGTAAIVRSTVPSSEKASWQRKLIINSKCKHCVGSLCSCAMYIALFLLKGNILQIANNVYSMFSNYGNHRQLSFKTEDGFLQINLSETMRLIN